MAQLTHRTRLTAPSFPLISEDMGQSVLVTPQISKEETQGNDPEITYMHNMMPTKEGIVSVGYVPVIDAVGDEAQFEDVRIIYGNLRTRLHLALSGNGALYILKTNATAWIEIPFNDPVTGVLVTTGTVDGVTYVYFQGVGAFIYNETADQFVPVVLTGLDVANIIGVTASSGHLIAYTNNALAWSSTVTPSDFVPSASTGAGGGAVADIDGDIVFVVPNSLGILIYSQANVVAATYTGNRQYPFKAREVTDSKGALNLDLVAYEANSKDHYAFGKAGIQAVDSQRAGTFLPEVTDFLTGQQLEDFDETSEVLSITNLTDTMLKKVKLIASRYLVISYGIEEFTHALVYDIVLNRLGKLKVTHTDIFEYIGGVHQEVARHTLGVLLKTGAVLIADWSVEDTTSGVVIVGRYQYIRQRTLILQEVRAGNIEAESALTCTAYVSLDGFATTSKKTGYPAYVGDKSRTYNFDTEGINVSVLLIGKMDINSILITFAVGGKY